MLGAPVAGSQVLQDCHQQSSVETVAISCKTRLLLSAKKVLCMACILQFGGCWQPGPQDCHQQGSVEAVAIPGKVTLLFSAPKVLCMVCILQFGGCWQPGPQDCHQQGSVEAVAIPGKVTLLLSALKVLCKACILQFVRCWQPGPPRSPPAALCRSSCHPLQGGIVVVSTEGTLYGMHPSASFSCFGASRLAKVASSMCL